MTTYLVRVPAELIFQVEAESIADALDEAYELVEDAQATTDMDIFDRATLAATVTDLDGNVLEE